MATAPKVTFMNGATKVAEVASANGKVVLPGSDVATPTLTVESGYAAKALTFVGWAKADGTDVTANTDITEDMTVYAKYDTGVIKGDVNGNGSIDTMDRTAIHLYISTNGANKMFGTGIDAYKSTGIIAGDVNGNNAIDTMDRTAVHLHISTNGANKMFKIGEEIYYINK